MYWYIKYPLVLAGCALLACCLYLVWGKYRGRAPVSPGGTRTENASSRPAPGGVGHGLVVPSAEMLATFTDRLAAAEDQLVKDNPVGARGLAEKVLAAPDMPRFTPLWFRAGDIIGKANLLILNSDVPAPEKIRYVIQPGDTLVGVANHFQTTVAAIEHGNKLDLTRVTIYPGMVISVYPAKWSVEVLKSKFVLLLCDGSRLFKYYRIGIGRQNRTPVGVFKLQTKLREPIWTPPGRVIPYGDPANVLGTRWLGLQPTDDTDPRLKGFGLHGTWQPETVGGAASEGCVRLTNEDIEELFEILPINTRVAIKEE